MRIYNFLFYSGRVSHKYFFVICNCKCGFQQTKRVNTLYFVSSRRVARVKWRLTYTIQIQVKTHMCSLCTNESNRFSCTAQLLFICKISLDFEIETGNKLNTDNLHEIV